MEANKFTWIFKLNIILIKSNYYFQHINVWTCGTIQPLIIWLIITNPNQWLIVYGTIQWFQWLMKNDDWKQKNKTITSHNLMTPEHFVGAWTGWGDAGNVLWWLTDDVWRSRDTLPWRGSSMGDRHAPAPGGCAVGRVRRRTTDGMTRWLLRGAPEWVSNEVAASEKQVKRTDYHFIKR